jgi:hypothetical protein
MRRSVLGTGVEQTPHLEEPEDSSRAHGKGGAIELCFQLLSSGRKLDEVLAELAASPGMLAEGSADPGIVSGTAAARLDDAGAVQLLVEEQARHRFALEPDGVAQAKSLLAEWIADRTASLGTTEPYVHAPLQTNASLSITSPRSGPREDSAESPTIATHHSRSGWLVTARQLGFFIVCGVLIAGGASAAWWAEHRTSPDQARTTGSVAFSGADAAVPAVKTPAESKIVARPLSQTATQMAVVAKAAPGSTVTPPPVRPLLSPAIPNAAASAVPTPPRAGGPQRREVAAVPAASPLHVRPAVIRNPLSVSNSKAGPGAPIASKTEVTDLLRRGDALLATGDVTSARLFYRRGAEAGSGTSALRLGETFDQAFLDQAGLRQVAGDTRKALYWYRWAHDLGVADADLLLKKIEPGK